MEFKKPQLEDLKIYKKWFKYGEMSCEYSFLNAYMWQHVWEYEFAVFNDCLVIRLDVDGVKIYNLPIGENMLEAVKQIEKIENGNARFAAAEGKMFDIFKEHFGEKYDFEPIDENSEYIYLQKDLAELSGKKYHQKRNHISAFIRKYNWRFELLDGDNVDDALLVSKLWLEEREDGDDNELLEEYRSIEKALENLKELEIIGALLYVDDKPIGCTFGLAVSDDVFDVNIEKALGDYQGAYAFINNMFAKNCLESYKYINREDDLGLPGLRRSKLSYRPHIILKKYLATAKVK